MYLRTNCNIFMWKKKNSHLITKYNNSCTSKYIAIYMPVFVYYITSVGFLVFFQLLWIFIFYIYYRRYGTHFYPLKKPEEWMASIVVCDGIFVFALVATVDVLLADLAQLFLISIWSSTSSMNTLFFVWSRSVSLHFIKPHSNLVSKLFTESSSKIGSFFVLIAINMLFFK